MKSANENSLQLQIYNHLNVYFGHLGSKKLLG